MRDLVEVIRAGTQAFSSLGVPYVIIGGVASNLLGRPRSTFDVDIVADLAPEDATRLARAFRRRGFGVSEEDIRDALRERTQFSAFDDASEYRLDCEAANTPFERATLAERQRVRIDDSFVYIDVPENLIVAKLVLGSEQDVLDAEAVYARQRPDLNLDRLADRARILGVLREWEALRGRVDALLDED